MSQEVLVAIIAVVPTTLAVILGFLASRRSTHQSVAVPLIQALRQLDAKTDRIDSEVRRRLDRLDDELGELQTGQTDIRERIARRRSPLISVAGWDLPVLRGSDLRS